MERNGSNQYFVRLLIESMGLNLFLTCFTVHLALSL